MNELTLYLVVVLCQFQHLFDDGLIELAVLTVVLQGEAFHPALLMQVQQHLRGNKITVQLDLLSKKVNECTVEPFAPVRFSCN